MNSKAADILAELEQEEKAAGKGKDPQGGRRGRGRGRHGKGNGTYIKRIGFCNSNLLFVMNFELKQCSQ